MSIVIDELEALVLDALPGEDAAENASYIRELVHRLTLTANELDPEPTATPTGTRDAPASGQPARPQPHPFSGYDLAVDPGSDDDQE